jgi:hypothetical protein
MISLLLLLLSIKAPILGEFHKMARQGSWEPLARKKKKRNHKSFSVPILKINVRVGNFKGRRFVVQ